MIYRVVYSENVTNLASDKGTCWAHFSPASFVVCIFMVHSLVSHCLTINAYVIQVFFFHEELRIKENRDSGKN